MECQETILQLAASTDGTQAPRGELAVHLEGCPECRQMRERLAEVDARLESWAGSFQPSADFDAKLLARIDGEMASVRRARQFRETRGFDAARLGATVRRDAWLSGIRVVLEGLGWGAVAVVVVLVGYGQLAAHAAMPSTTNLLTALAAAVVAGTLGLATDSGNRLLRRWMGHLLA